MRRRRRFRRFSARRRRVRVMIVLCVAVGVAAMTARLPPSSVLREAYRDIQALAAGTGQYLKPVGVQIGRGAGSTPAGGRLLEGRVRVIDGDTIEVSGQRVRLFGIDAPEQGQDCRVGGIGNPCGRAATKALAGRVGGRWASCREQDRDRYGRIVAVCRSGGIDISRWMVRQGHAFAYRRYSERYVGDERGARAARRGIWRGEVVPPWEWRKGQR